LCPENHEKRGTKRGTRLLALRAMETARNRMKISNKLKQVGDPDDFDEGTYRLAVSNECIEISKRLVRTKTDDRALAAGGSQ
jgi:hypothetical protein